MGGLAGNDFDVIALTLDSLDPLSCHWTRIGLKQTRIGLTFGCTSDISGYALDNLWTHFANLWTPS